MALFSVVPASPVRPTFCQALGCPEVVSVLGELLGELAQFGGQRYAGCIDRGEGL